MPLITGLITENLTVTAEAEATGQDAAGGSTPVWTAVATGLSVFFGNPRGGRPGDFHGDNARDRATFASSSPVIGRTDVRFHVTAASDPSLADLVGTYWRASAPDSPVDFPAGSLGIVPARYEAEVSRFVVPS